MTTHKTYPSQGIIISKTMKIPLNGDPSTVTFLVDVDPGGKIGKYTGIVKDYSEEFLMECIGQTVPLLIGPEYYPDGTFKGYMITELNDPNKEEE